MIQGRVQIVGLGQCGSRIGSEFERIGIPVLYANSDEVDVRGMKVDQAKLLLVERTGTGGSPTKGRQMYEKHSQEFESFYLENLVKTKLVIFIVGLGGGSGSGFLIPSIEFLQSTGYKVGVIATLPPKMLGMLAMDNAMRVLQQLREIELSLFIIADNEHLLQRIGISTTWWQEINYYIVSQIIVAFDICREGKTSHSGIGSIDEGEVLRILQYGKGLLDIKEVYFKSAEINMTDDEIKERIFSQTMLPGLNYRETLAYMINIDTPIKGGHTQFSSRVFDIIKKSCGSSISRLGMFIDPLLDGAVRVSFMSAGLKLPKYVQRQVNSLKKDVSRHEDKKLKTDHVDFNEISEIRLEEDFDL